MPKFVRCAKRLFGRRQSREFLVKNVRCLKRKKALSDTFIELGPMSLAENNSHSFSRRISTSLKINQKKSKSTGNLYCFDSKPKGSFRFDMESLDFQYSENETFLFKKPKTVPS